MGLWLLEMIHVGTKQRNSVPDMRNAESPFLMSGTYCVRALMESVER
jgi:hypothetical protein